MSEVAGTIDGGGTFRCNQTFTEDPFPKDFQLGVLPKSITGRLEDELQGFRIRDQEQVFLKFGENTFLLLRWILQPLTPSGPLTSTTSP